jgi:predicted CoA-substrate-specific enzyme activase
MNDKCAAGTGRFFEQAARILDTPHSEFAELISKSQRSLELNSTCGVFAESEIVSLMAEGVAKEDIIKALCFAVAKRISSLMGKIEGNVYLDGGPAKNSALISALSWELMTNVEVLEEPQYTVAYGAAMML